MMKEKRDVKSVYYGASPIGPSVNIMKKHSCWKYHHCFLIDVCNKPDKITNLRLSYNFPPITLANKWLVLIELHFCVLSRPYGFQ